MYQTSSHRHCWMLDLETHIRGWGFSSVVERLPSKCKALGSVLSSGGEKKKKHILDSAIMGTSGQGEDKCLRDGDTTEQIHTK